MAAKDEVAIIDTNCLMMILIKEFLINKSIILLNFNWKYFKLNKVLLWIIYDSSLS